jgi:hypothetical protein
MAGSPHLRSATLLAASLVALTQGACVILPVLRAPELSGRVVDASSGRPIANAVVVLRVDARYDELLPDRDLVGHLETTSDAAGHFRAGPIWKPGLTVWPIVRTEARVVGVMRSGYRCPKPIAIENPGRVEVKLTRALDLADRRSSCRPVPATSGEAPLYLAGWNELFPPDATPADLEREQQLHRVLEARAAFGFGENCEGPIADLALAPGGTRAAYLDRWRGTVEVLEFGRNARRVARVPIPARDAEEGAVDTRRLAWTGADELVLWEPAGRMDRTRSLSVLSVTGAAPQVVWRAERDGPPASSAEFSKQRPSRRPLDPADLNDEGDALWLGRSFALRRALDAESGLGRDVLHITEDDGRVREIDLPGEVCGPRGQFGRPHYRIAADARTALDLRYVRGACHAVAIDLEKGAWVVLDAAAGKGECREVRRVPATHLSTAARGYARDIETALAEAGADPAAAYSLEIRSDGSARALSRSYEGEAVSAALPPFPIATPLRRIDVTAVGSGGTGERAPGTQTVPTIEPL